MARWTIQGLQNGTRHAITGMATIVKNPDIRKQRFLKIFISITVLSFILLGVTNILVAIPIQVIKTILSMSTNEKASQADQFLSLISKNIREIVASVPFFTLLCMRYIYPKPFDDLFMETLRYLEALHPERPSYTRVLVKKKMKARYWQDIKDYIRRTWNKARWGILLFCLSFIPFIGKLVFPLAGAYTTYIALGKTQAVAAGITFFFLPRWASMKLVRALLGMRSLLRELYTPYFVRMRMTHREKRDWFSGKKDMLFGFSAIAYVIIRLPIFGVIGYGIAQATAAYMLTVVTEPPVPEEEHVDTLDVSKKQKSSLVERKKGDKAL